METNALNGPSSTGGLVWFITGTSSGFGRRLVHSALARGDKVVATARTIEHIRDFPKTDNLRLLQLDVTAGTESTKSKVDEAITYFGRIDVVVNNTGIGVPSEPKILSLPTSTYNNYPDYNPMREKAKQVVKVIDGNQPNDPVKAMELLVDVVRGEGKAKGRKWPLHLPLSEEAEEAIRVKCGVMLNVVDEWGELIRDMRFDDYQVQGVNNA